jgi:hypothetical protein
MLTLRFTPNELEKAVTDVLSITRAGFRPAEAITAIK